MNATRLFGPAVAGVMVATINLESVYFLQAALYVVSCGLLLFVPTGLGAASAVARGNMFREIGNGLAYVARDSRLRQLNISMLAISFFAMPYVMLLAGFVHEDLGKGDAAFGFLQSVSGVGALVGSLAVATLKLVLTQEGGLTINREDDIVAACLMCSGGEVLRKN